MSRRWVGWRGRAHCAFASPERNLTHSLTSPIHQLLKLLSLYLHRTPNKTTFTLLFSLSSNPKSYWFYLCHGQHHSPSAPRSPHFPNGPWSRTPPKQGRSSSKVLTLGGVQKSEKSIHWDGPHSLTKFRQSSVS